MSSFILNNILITLALCGKFSFIHSKRRNTLGFFVPPHKYTTINLVDDRQTTHFRIYLVQRIGDVFWARTDVKPFQVSQRQPRV